MQGHGGVSLGEANAVIDAAVEKKANRYCSFAADIETLERSEEPLQLRSLVSCRNADRDGGQCRYLSPASIRINANLGVEPSQSQFSTQRSTARSDVVCKDDAHKARNKMLKNQKRSPHIALQH